MAQLELGKTGEYLRLANLVDLNAIQKMADAHYTSAGMPIGLVDAYDNSVLVGAGWQDICTKFHRVHPEALKRCEESDNLIKANLKKGNFSSYKCLNGLWDIGMPVFVFDEHMATLFLGQFFYEEEVPDRSFFADQAERYQFEQKAYLEALDRVPVFPREKVQMILQYDLALAAFIAELAEKSYLQKKAEAEQAKLEIRLRQAEKMETVGRLAGGIAHDFNNMLGVIMGQAELSMLNLAPGSKLYTDFENILEAAKHSADLTHQLLAFARQQVIKPRVVDLEKVIGNMLKVLRRIIGENIELHWKRHPDLWQVQIDPAQINQVLANLCSNSRDSIDSVGSIAIEASNCVIDDPEFAGVDQLQMGDYVKLTVSDTGRGMDAKTQEHIFEPFFTTKSKGKGTGLGLSTVYGIVKQHKGIITVHSEPGNGTEINVYFPRHQKDQVVSTTKEKHEEVARRKELVLLVEDDRNILAITKKMLEKLGYRTIAVNDPTEAVELIAEQQTPIDILLTDVVMPKLSGSALADTVKRHFPKCKVVFMSGYTGDMITQHSVTQRDVYFIQKPYTIKELGSHLREALCSD